MTAMGAWHRLPLVANVQWHRVPGTRYHGCLDSPRVSDIHVVVLAAGKGTRMKSQLPKVLHQIDPISRIRSPLTGLHAYCLMMLTLQGFFSPLS